MQEIAHVRVRYGYRRIQVLLHREGWRVGKTLTYRVYREEKLQLRSKLPKRRKMVVTRRYVYVPKRPNQAWAMDFVSDQLTNGERFRALTIVDVFTRESLAIEVGRCLRADHVIDAMVRINPLDVSQLLDVRIKERFSVSPVSVNCPTHYAQCLCDPMKREAKKIV